MPRVSVVIPNYNHARYLPKRIESVMAQQFQDIEILLLDDCSKDSSRNVIMAYAAQDSRIKPVFNGQNSGSTFKQWQKGLDLAAGQYVWIAESDDFAEPNFLTEVVARLDAQPSAVLAYANSWIVDEHDTRLGTTADWKNQHFATQHWSHDFLSAGDDELRRYLSKACTINNASAVLFRRSALAGTGIDTTFRYAGDWLVYLKLSLLGDIVYTGQCLSSYREHAANASKKSVADGSQLFERLKCCAFVHRSGRLGAQATAEMLEWSAREMLALNYLLLRKSWQPRKMWRFIKGIAAIDARFYVQLQHQAVRLLKQQKAAGPAAG